MADPDNDHENDLENPADDDSFLKDPFGSDSQLDELTFSEDELSAPPPAQASSVDDLLGSPLESIDSPPPIPSPDPLLDGIPDQVSNAHLPDELPAFETTAIPPRPRDSNTVQPNEFLDQAMRGDPSIPPTPEPSAANESVDGGNQRLDASQRPRRERPRPHQAPPLSEDEIVFDDGEFSAETPEEIPAAEIVPPIEEIPAPAPAFKATPVEIPEPPVEPEPAFEPEPLIVEELPPVPEVELEPTPEPSIDPNPQPLVADDVELQSIATSDPATIKNIGLDEDFEDLPDVPELELPPIESPEVVPENAEALISELATEPGTEPLDEVGENFVGVTDAKSQSGGIKGFIGQLKPLEMACLAVIFVGTLIGAYLFSDWTKKGTPKRTIKAKPSEVVPSAIQGQIADIGKLEAYWRPKTETDSSKIVSDFLPELNITLNGGSQGFLLAIFRNAEGDLIDTADQKIEGGKFATNGTTTATLTSSTGLLNEFTMSTYQAEDKWRWSVTLRESVDQKQWKDLAVFYLPGEIR